jgi:hypothetical protein
VTVQTLEEFCARVVGLQLSDDTFAGGTKLTLAAADVPLYVAVTVAV